LSAAVNRRLRRPRKGGTKSFGFLRRLRGPLLGAAGATLVPVLVSTQSGSGQDELDVRRLQFSRRARRQRRDELERLRRGRINNLGEPPVQQSFSFIT
jgi:hypothetical protein